MPSRQFETADNRDFWNAAGEGRLIFQTCRDCGHVQHPPRHLCGSCWSDALANVQSTGCGRIESLTVVRRAPVSAFRAKVPYVVVAVAMDEGPRMIANLLGDDAQDAQPDDRVTVCFETDESGQVLPQFMLAQA